MPKPEITEITTKSGPSEVPLQAKETPIIEAANQRAIETKRGNRVFKKSYY